LIIIKNIIKKKYTRVYSISWNLLDYTCGIVPITTVKPEETHYRVNDVNDLAKKTLVRAMKDAQGLPVSV